MRIKLTDIGREWGLNPDQMFAFAKEHEGYGLGGQTVDDASIPIVMKRQLVYDFKQANKGGDWRTKLVAESLEEFFGNTLYEEDGEIITTWGPHDTPVGEEPTKIRPVNPRRYNKKFKKEERLQNKEARRERIKKLLAKNKKNLMNEAHIGADTAWTVKYKGKEITITLKNVNNYLDKNNIKTKIINPKSLESLLIKVKRDESRVQKANLDYPIIVTKQNGKFTKILDGQHRVVKCINNNIDKIKARILDLDNAPDSYKIVFR